MLGIKIVHARMNSCRRLPFIFLYLLCALSVFINCAEPIPQQGLKIVSLSPAMTELLFSLGAGAQIVGITTFCDYPESTKYLPKVGDFSHPSIERIIGLQPNLVIVNLPEQQRVKMSLEKLGIKIFVSSPKSLNDIYQEIIAIGKVLKKEAVADSLINYMQAHIKPAKRARKMRVYVELSPRPLVTIGHESFLNELLSLAGGENIFSDLEQPYPVVTQEEIIKRNPEIILILHPEGLKDRTGWQKISALEHGRIFTDLDQDCLMRPGPRLVEGFRQLNQVLHE